MTWEWVAFTGIVCVFLVFAAAIVTAPRKREKITEVFRGRARVWWEEGRWWVVAWTEMGVRFRVYCLSAAEAADWARGVLGVRS